MGLKLASATPTLAAMSRWPVSVALMLSALAPLRAQESGTSPAPSAPEPLGPMLAQQEPPKVVPRLLEGADPSQASIHVSLGKQRAYLSIGNEVAVDTPVSTGKPRAMTPKGEFKVLEKKTSASSRFFGDYVDGGGRVMRAAVSTRTDAAPSGATFRAVPVQYCLRLDDNGLALHAGPQPGYPAADCAVWLPADIAPLFFQRVQVGTPVKIGD